MSLALTSAATQTQSAAVYRQNLVKTLHNATISRSSVSTPFTLTQPCTASGFCNSLAKSWRSRRLGGGQPNSVKEWHLKCPSQSVRLLMCKADSRQTHAKETEKVENDLRVGLNLDPRGCQLNTKCRTWTALSAALLLRKSADSHFASHCPVCLSRLVCAFFDV